MNNEKAASRTGATIQKAHFHHIKKIKIGCDQKSYTDYHSYVMADAVSHAIMADSLKY